MTYRPVSYSADEFDELVTQLRARKAIEAEAIAEGGSDIVWDDGPMTAAERREMGLDRYFGDEEDQATADAAPGPAASTGRP